MIPVILVDEKDQEIGTGEKLAVHEEGLLHRAFSVFIYNSEGELLIQRRALGKYHSPGLWANTCCGHPFPGESVQEAVNRRLREEMGFACALTPRTEILYTLKLADGLFEREYVHVYEGHVDAVDLKPDPEEVSEFTWVTPEELREEARTKPELYARWFRLYLLKYFDSVFSGVAQKTHRAA